jgi:hypothetical protein
MPLYPILKKVYYLGKDFPGLGIIFTAIKPAILSQISHSSLHDGHGFTSLDYPPLPQNTLRPKGVALPKENGAA